MTWRLLVALLAVGGTQAGSPDGDALAVHAVRFYRDGRTLVDGFIRIPHAALDPVSLQNGGFAAFRVEVEVADATGAMLTRESWTRRVDWAATRIPGTSTLEVLSLALAPGEYDVRVTLTDSASGRRLATETRVAAYSAPPGVSDLLLAERIRGGAGEAAPAEAGEMRKGDLFVTASPHLVLRPSAATLYVYGEAYRERLDTVAWHLVVIGPDGRVLASTAPRQTVVEAGGGVLTGALDLAGLPPGTYTLRAVVGLGADTTSRSATFTMGGLELERRVAQASLDLEAPADTFARAPDAELDSLFAPLVYVPESGDLKLYAGLSVDGKRRFLRAFWARRDPTPGTARNEAMAGFYARIAAANRRFAEGGTASIPGWRTDRGRVFLIHGEPNDLLRRPSTGSAPPWEAWKYSAERPRKYVFLDATRLGNFALIYSDDRQERSYPNWDAIIGAEAAEEIRRF